MRIMTGNARYLSRLDKAFALHQPVCLRCHQELIILPVKTEAGKYSSSRGYADPV